MSCADLPTTSLEHLIATADLQSRVDRKYLVPPVALAELLTRLEGRLRVLDIDGRRLFQYESVYFDTPELLAHHQHVGGRGRRFKVRTRTYGDSAESMLEIKTAGGRDETVKDRHPYQLGERYELNPWAREVVGRRLGDTALAERLKQSLVSRYHRATLVEPATGSRLTCDVDLDFENDRRRRTGPDDLVLIKSKTVGRPRSPTAPCGASVIGRPRSPVLPGSGSAPSPVAGQPVEPHPPGSFWLVTGPDGVSPAPTA